MSVAALVVRDVADIDVDDWIYTVILLLGCVIIALVALGLLVPSALELALRLLVMTLAAVSVLLGIVLGIVGVYSLAWFRSTSSVLAMCTVGILMWIAPFVALWLLFVRPMLLSLVSCLLFFLSAYIWSWLLSHWDIVRWG